MMSSGQIILIVVSAVAALLFLLAAILILILRKLKRLPDDLRDELKVTGERITLGPQSAQYMGATAEYTRVGGNGIIALTDRRLVFRKIIGKPLDFRLEHVTGVHEAKSFLGQRWSGGFLVVELSRGVQLGFRMKNHAGWIAAISETTNRKPL